VRVGQGQQSARILRVGSVVSDSNQERISRQYVQRRCLGYVRIRALHANHGAGRTRIYKYNASRRRQQFAIHRRETIDVQVTFTRA